MKFNELKKLPADELNKKISEIKLDLMKLNAQVAIGTTPKSTKQIRELKRTIAKIETLKYQQAEKKVSKIIDVKKKKYMHS